MHAIDVDTLTVRHADLVAVDRVSFHVDEGEIVALLGPNGAGKTSTLEALEGYLTPSGGTATIFGALGPGRGQTNETLGVLLQEDGVYPAAKPIEVVRHFRALYGNSGPDPETLLARVGLTDRSKTTIRRLSGGEKRRLGLALALVGDPRALLLDEPTSGVDHAGRQTLRDVIGASRDAGAAILLTTHELDEAQHLADRIVIIDHGRIITSGTPEELTRATAASGIRFTAEADLDLTYLVITLGAQIVEVAPGEYQASVAPTPEAVAKLTAWMADRRILLGEIRAGRHRLEDVFDRLTQSAGTDAPDPSSGRGPQR